MKGEYKTISGNLETEIKIQKSKFIANSMRVNSVDEFAESLTSIKKKYFDAGHHPFAYLIVSETSDIVKYSDDGEPSLSSGKPILDAINKYDLKNVAVIVTRYFGGVKLGVGGLRRAYFDATDENLCQVKTVIIHDTARLKLIFDYSFINSIMRFLQENSCKIIENDSDEKVKLEIEFIKAEKKILLKNFIEITNGSIEINEK